MCGLIHISLLKGKLFLGISQNKMYAGLAICHYWLPMLLITELPLRKLIKSSFFSNSRYYLVSHQSVLEGKGKEDGHDK